MIHADQSLSRRLENTEGSANAGFIEARAAISPEIGAEWIEVAGARAMFDGAESPLTQTFGLGLFDEITGAELEKLEDFFRRRRAPVFHEVSPLAPPSLLTLLNERNYRPVELTSVMFQPLAPSNLAGLKINPEIRTRVIEKGEEEIWARASAAGWATEMEGLADFMFEFGKVGAHAKGGYPFLAELDGRPISAGMLFIYDGVALLAGASTIPEGRKRGAQTALLDARLRFAAENGCTIAMMGAAPGSQSQRNAEKNNFRVAYTRTKWQLKEETP